MTLRLVLAVAVLAVFGVALGATLESFEDGPVACSVVVWEPPGELSGGDPFGTPEAPAIRVPSCCPEVAATPEGTPGEVGATPGLGTPAPTQAPSATPLTVAEERLLQLHNDARREAGVRELALEARLVAAARSRAADMAARGYFAHVDAEGVAWTAALERAGYVYRLAGENLHWNTHPAEVAADVAHASFMASAGHRGNVLNAGFEEAGVAMVRDAGGRNIFVVLFGAPLY